MKTQYERILSHLRRAGRKGATVRDLLKYTNYPSARLHEMTWYGGLTKDFSTDRMEKIDRTWKEVNGKRIRVYILRRI